MKLNDYAVDYTSRTLGTKQVVVPGRNTAEVWLSAPDSIDYRHKTCVTKLVVRNGDYS